MNTENMVGFEGLGIPPFVMDRVAFSIGSFNIYWYAILITLGLILAVAFALWQARKFDVTTDNIIDVLLFGLPAAIICARAFYVIFEWDRYNTFAEMINIRDGGLAIYGGIIGAFVTGFVYCRVKKVNMLALFDLASLCFLIGQAIGRWGNFVNAEAYGTETNLPWAMSLVVVKNGVQEVIHCHPTFLYESLWNCLGFALLLLFNKKWKKHHGETFFLYFAWYGFGRFFIEGLRTDSLYLIDEVLRISQALGALFFIGGVVFFILSRKGIIVKWQNKIIAKSVKKQQEYKPVYIPLLKNQGESLGEGETTEQLNDKNPAEESKIPREINEEETHG